MLELENVQYSYGSTPVLSLERWALGAGQHALVLGPSGCGKSTLLHLLGGILPSQQGRITIDGTDLTQLIGAALDAFRGQHIGLVFQQAHLLKHLTVRQNLLLAQSMAGLKADRAAIDKVLSELELSDKADARISRLSGGQQQRVAIARATLNEPKLLLADEPTASLDDANAQRVIDVLRSQADRHGATLIVATHDKRIQAAFKEVLNLEPIAA